MERIRILLIIFIFALALSSCQSVLHKHYMQNGGYDTRHALTLSEDSTYQLEINEGFLHDTIFGKWSVLNNRKLVLSPYKLSNYHNVTNLDTCTGKLYIETYAYPESYELELPQISVFSEGIMVYSEISKCLDSKLLQLADSIRIDYVGQVPYVFTPQIKGCGLAKIFLISQQQERLQKPQIYTIKKNRLIERPNKLILVGGDFHK